MLPSQVTKILLVEDNPGDARLLRERLSETAELPFELFHCATLAQALESLAKESPDVLVLDLGLPDAQGLESVRRVRQAAPEVPLLVLTGMSDGDLAVRSLQEGAQDYLVKGQIDGALVWRALRYGAERQRVQLELLSRSQTDDLTGLNNRRGFVTLAEHHLRVAYRQGKSFLIGFVDVDGLKQVNDTFGHQEGNRALVDTANVLKDSFRQSDILARLGGDEFAVLIAEATEDRIGTVVGRIQQKLEVCNAAPNRKYPLRFSIGIVPGDAGRRCDLEQLLHEADAVMYQQKQKRGGRVS
jgi:two-component system cell cycle response regulator